MRDKILWQGAGYENTQTVHFLAASDQRAPLPNISEPGMGLELRNRKITT